MSVLAWLRNPTLRGIWIGLACALVAWLAMQQSLLRGLEDWLLDGCFSLRGRRPTQARIVIIALDGPSLAAQKKPLTSLSPELARVVLFAKLQGAKAIGVDVLLPADRENLDALKADKEGNALAMGRAVVKAGIVTLPVWRLDREHWTWPVWQWRLKAEHDPEVADFGYVNLQEDGDQFVRRQQLLGKVKDENGERLLLQLALALYARLHGPDIDINEAGQPVIGGEVIPTDAEGKIRINYVGPPGSFEEISFGRVLEAEEKKERLPQLDGAVVLIGVTARDQQDYHSTPYANHYSRCCAIYTKWWQSQPVSRRISGWVLVWTEPLRTKSAICRT